MSTTPMKTKQNPSAELMGFCYNYFRTLLMASITLGELKNLFNLADDSLNSWWHFSQKCPLTFGKLWCLHNSGFDFIYFKERSARSNYSLAYPLTFVKSVVLYFCQVLTKIWLNIGGCPQKNYSLHHI